MVKIDWKRKLSSRKFWALLCAIATALLTVFNVDKLTIEQVTVIIGAFGTMIAYILGESIVDASSKKGSDNNGN
jgi:hypothetical protein